MLAWGLFQGWYMVYYIYDYASWGLFRPEKQRKYICRNSNSRGRTVEKQGSREATQQTSKEAKKQGSRQRKKSSKAKSREAEKQLSRETEIKNSLPFSSIFLQQLGPVWHFLKDLCRLMSCSHDDRIKNQAHHQEKVRHSMSVEA